MDSMDMRTKNECPFVHRVHLVHYVHCVHHVHFVHRPFRRRTNCFL